MPRRTGRLNCGIRFYNDLLLTGRRPGRLKNLLRSTIVEVRLAGCETRAGVKRFEVDLVRRSSAANFGGQGGTLSYILI